MQTEVDTTWIGLNFGLGLNVWSGDHVSLQWEVFHLYQPVILLSKKVYLESESANKQSIDLLNQQHQLWRTGLGNFSLKWHF